MNAANGDYIFFLDSDDWIKKDCIQILVNLIISYNTAIVQCNYTSVYGYTKRKKQPAIKQTTYRDLELEKDLLSKCGGVWNKLYKHSAIEEFRFLKWLWYEDNAFIYPLLTKTKKLIVTNEILYYYQRHLNSITLSTKFFPNPKIFDKFDIIDHIKEKCVLLGTYEEYKKQLFQITKTKLLSILLECTTWFQIPSKERKILIQNIYTFILQNYDMDNLDSLIKDVNLDRLDKLRMPLLLQNINKNNNVYVEDYLEEAKEIITRYRKK